MTLNIYLLNWCNDNRLIGFALCVILGLEDMQDEERRDNVFSYRFVVESNDGIHIFPNNDPLRYYFRRMGELRFIVHDHTFL